MKVKALTVKQPWASLIVHDIKDIENRTWPFPKKYIGQRVLIHASKALCRKSIFETLTTDQYKMFRNKVGYSGLDYLEPKGAIIGSVEIVNCVLNHPSLWTEKGVYHWILSNPILFEKPIENVKGKLGLWNYDMIE